MALFPNKVVFWGARGSDISISIWGDVIQPMGFPGGAVVKNPAADAGHLCLIPGLEQSPGGGNGHPPSILAWDIPWTEEPGGLRFEAVKSWTRDWAQLGCNSIHSSLPGHSVLYKKVSAGTDRLRVCHLCDWMLSVLEKGHKNRNRQWSGFRTGSKTSPVPCVLFKFIIVCSALNGIKTSSSWLLIFTCTQGRPQYLELWSVPRGVGKKRDRLRAYWSSPIGQRLACSVQAKSDCCLLNQLYLFLGYFCSTVKS